MSIKLLANNLFKQLIKFGLVGISGATVDFGFFNLFIIVLKINLYLATSLSFTLALFNNFIWNKIWTFRSQSSDFKHASKELVKFALVSTIGLGLNLILMWFGKNHTLLGNSLLGLNIARGIAILVVAGWNFLGSKLWVFR